MASTSSFFIEGCLIGAPKAGTTSLYRYLVQHPQLAGHAAREMAFFLDDEEYAQGFKAALRNYWPEHDSGGAMPDAPKLLAKHVFHMMFDHGVARLASHHSSMRLIVVLRNPVDRAYSAFQYARRRGWEDAPTFEDALEYEAMRRQPPQSNEDASHPHGPDWTHRTELYRHTGHYALHLKRVFDNFPRDQIHVVLTDDLKHDAAAVCRACFEHLGVDPEYQPDLTREHNAARQARSQNLSRVMARFFRSRGAAKKMARAAVPRPLRRRLRHTAMAINERPATSDQSIPIDPATRARLVDEFAPLNATLATLIHRELSHWDQ